MGARIGGNAAGLAIYRVRHAPDGLRSSAYTAIVHCSGKVPPCFDSALRRHSPCGAVRPPVAVPRAAGGAVHVPKAALQAARRSRSGSTSSSGAVRSSSCPRVGSLWTGKSNASSLRPDLRPEHGGCHAKWLQHEDAAAADCVAHLIAPECSICPVFSKLGECREETESHTRLYCFQQPEAKGWQLLPQFFHISSSRLESDRR